MNRRLTVALSATTLLLLTAACSNESQGTPSPTPSNSATPGKSTENPPSGNPLNGLQACQVLDKALQGDGFPASAKNTAGGDNGCSTDKTGYGFVGLDLHDDLGLGDINADKSQQFPIKINGRPSIEIREGLGVRGACDIAMEVTKNSRAVLTVSLKSANLDETCAFVEKISEKVEPELPK